MRAGYADSVLPLSALFDNSDLPDAQPDRRPAMIWFSKLEPDEKLEKRMFDNIDVAIASRWFHCVRIYVDDIESKGDREKYAKVVPTVIFLDASGREIRRLSGTGISGPNVFGAMQKASEQDFKKPLTALVKGYADFLKKFDKVQGDVSELEQAIVDGLAHIAKHDCAPGRKRLKEDEEAIKPLQVERDKLLEDEKSLLKPELKTARGETASAGG